MEFYVIRSEETRRKVAEVCYNQQWMTQVPVFIVDIPLKHGDFIV